MTYDLQIEKLIDATPDEAFAAFTEPDAMLHWYRGAPDWKVEVVASDFRIGGTTSVVFGCAAQGWECREDMTYREIDPPHRIVYDQTFAAGYAYDTVVTVTFADQDGKTLVTVVETGYPNVEERDAHQGGWPGFIDRLEEAVLNRRASA